MIFWTILTLLNFFFAWSDLNSGHGLLSYICAAANMAVGFWCVTIFYIELKKWIEDKV